MSKVTGSILHHSSPCHPYDSVEYHPCTLIHKLRSNYEKSGFLRPQLSLKSKTNTNLQLFVCLIYHEIIQISERPL